jgi:hypothetical protein
LSISTWTTGPPIEQASLCEGARSSLPTEPPDGSMITAAAGTARSATPAIAACATSATTGCSAIKGSSKCPQNRYGRHNRWAKTYACCPIVHAIYPFNSGSSSPPT